MPQSARFQTVLTVYKGLVRRLKTVKTVGLPAHPVLPRLKSWVETKFLRFLQKFGMTQIIFSMLNHYSFVVIIAGLIANHSAVCRKQHFEVYLPFF